MSHKTWIYALMITLFSSCSTKEIANYNVIEDKVYDIPIKSQVSLRVELKDSAATKQQIIDLIQSLSAEQKDRSMKYHNTPTHVFIYVYNSQSEYEINSGSWIAMYQKIGTDDPGSYQYK